MPEPENGKLSFKQRKSFESRQEEVASIRARFPDKVPVVVERYHREKYLPLIDKTKFLAPAELTLSQFMGIIRTRMALSPNQAFYLLVNEKSIVSMSTTLSEIYRDEADPDGFLYMSYASQEMFGGCAECRWLSDRSRVGSDFCKLTACSANTLQAETPSQRSSV